MAISENGQTGHSLQFAVMCNSLVFQQWQADAIRGLISRGHRLVLLIRDIRIDDPRSIHTLNKRRKSKHRLFHFLNNRMFFPAAKSPVDMSAELEGIDSLPCSVRVEGYSEYFHEAEVEAIRIFELDFILRFGFNIVRGDILDAARFGVWSFHHDDELLYRGGPPGFWEICHRDNVSAAILQRLTGKLDAGIILKKGYLKTIHHSYKGNLNQLLTVSAHWPAQVADEILDYSEEFVSRSETMAPVFRLPSNRQMIGFLFRLLGNRIRFYYKELIAAEVWNIGLINKPIHEVALGDKPIQKTEIRWLRHFGETKYLADPFGFIERKKMHILLEDYSYSRKKATISEIIYDIARDSFSVPIRVIEGSRHLSYPCIIEHENSIFCVPESYRSSTVVLYRRNFSEEAFMEESVLLKGIEAVDPTLFFHGGYWWLLFTPKKYSTTHLMIYYAREINGPYQPHRRNPVKIDIRSARPGGLPFFHEGELYRPAQDCSATYGGSVVINKVLKLTPDDFREITVRVIDPVPGTPFNKGLHTLSKAGNYTLIDGKRYRINRFFFLSQMTDKLNKEYPENAE